MKHSPEHTTITVKTELDTDLKLLLHPAFAASGCQRRSSRAYPVTAHSAALPSRDREVAAEEQTGTTANRSTSRLPYTLLEGEMGMSRASLFNKMKAITGMGCNEYIIKIRMEKAILMKNI